MSRQENDRERKPADEDQREVDSEELSERISEALEPTLSDVSLRVAEAVTQSLSNQQRDTLDESAAESAQTTDGEPIPTEDESVEHQAKSDTINEPADTSAAASDADSTDDHPLLSKVAGALSSTISKGQSSKETPKSDASKAEPAHSHSSKDQSALRRTSETVFSSFMGSMREDGSEQYESVVNSLVDGLFSPRAKGWVRRFADRTLQATLHHTLRSIDDPAERYELYRETLSRLRPIVREAVDSMYTEQSRRLLKRQGIGAMEHIVKGDYRFGADHMTDALSEISDSAKGVFGQHKLDMLHTIQQVSTKLLQEAVSDQVEDKFDPEEIQQKMQDKVEDAREKLQEAIGGLQEGAHSVKDRLSDNRSGGTAGRSSPRGAPTGGPPSGQPPFGEPPSGKPPSGMPPSGKPPHGVPPKGIPPAVERRMKANQPSNGRSRRRR
jgi:hypothetical protein